MTDDNDDKDQFQRDLDAELKRTYGEATSDPLTQILASIIILEFVAIFIIACVRGLLDGGT